jgi:beta-fructofuranosidase
MVVGAGYADGRSAVRLYASTDLRDWVALGDGASLARQPGAGPEVGDAWECPQVLDLDGVSVVVVGTWSEQTGVNRVVSLSLGDEPTRLDVVDHGTNFYAASALRDSPFGPLLFGWVTEGRSAARWIEAGWAGALSLPRQVWLGADGSVRSSPVPTVDDLRVNGPRPADGATVGPQFELVVPSAPARVGLRFGETEQLAIVLDDGDDTLVVDRSAASIDDESHGDPSVAPGAFEESADRPAARIFVDGSIVEVFTSAGRVLTARVYPVTAPPWRIEASAGCTVWELHPGEH